MEVYRNLNKIKQIYQEGSNITLYLKEQQENTTDSILISYDFQAGSYINTYNNNPNYAEVYCKAISVIINNLGCYNSIIEIGIGEGTTMGVLLKYLQQTNQETYGFDISWSRVRYAKEFIRNQNKEQINLFTGDLFNIPLKDNSIDIVYTSHSIEPNGGREIEALKELYRIANKYIILLEPCYELASDEAKQRMEKFGYVKNLYQTALNLGYKVIEYRLFDMCINALNPTGLLIIEKDINVAQTSKEPFSCPITNTALERFEDCFATKDGLLVYPVIDKIPCLLPQNAIVATHFYDFR
jgi:SAM-dependent methyltransferase